MFVTDSLIVVGLATLSLGTIHETDGPQERTFWLRNVGQEAVALTQGYTSCGCTTIHFSKGVAVSPGDSTAVSLRFNPRGKGGDFHEVGTLVYQKAEGSSQSPAVSPTKRVTVTLAGSCITSEETLLRQFPVRISDTLRLSTVRFDLGIMHVGESRERTVVALRLPSQTQERISLRFTVDADTPKGLQHIVKKLKVGGQEVAVTLDILVK